MDVPRVKGGIRQILGKTVSGILYKADPVNCRRCHLYLAFTDGTYYELYSTSGAILTTGGVSHGTLDHIRKNTRDVIVFAAGSAETDVSQEFR